MTQNSDNAGKVFLVGAGPGDSGLLTLRAVDILQRADAVVYDRLVSQEVRRFSRKDAELHDVGKAAGCHTLSQDGIGLLLVALAKQGKMVCRLKGGDPFVFGRGGEEGSVLTAAGIAFEVVPGVSSSVAAPAYAGIPVTDRRHSRSFAVITGHGSDDATLETIEWDALARGVDTLVFLMGLQNLGNICQRLCAGGLPESHPAAAIERGTTNQQRVVVGTLATLSGLVQDAGLCSPVAIIVGNVVLLREELKWFENRPLLGQRVLVTRSRDQASRLSAQLAVLGADVEEIPLLAFAPITWTDIELAQVRRADWLVFSSVNGARCLGDYLQEAGLDCRALGSARVAAIGPETAESVRHLGLHVDCMPSSYRGEELADAIPDVDGKCIAFIGGEVSRGRAGEILGERGAEAIRLPIYRTYPDPQASALLHAWSGSGWIVTFASSLSVKYFLDIASADKLNGAQIACIGPVTAQTVREYGLPVAIEAKEYSIPGLVDEICAWVKEGPR